MTQQVKAGLGATLLLAALFCALAGIVVMAEMDERPAEACGLMCECWAGEKWLMCGERK